jgi:hypothetical protein
MSLGRPRGGIIGGAGADSMNKGPMLGHDHTATLPISTSTTNVATKHHINLKPEN